MSLEALIWSIYHSPRDLDSQELHALWTIAGMLAKETKQ